LGVLVVVALALTSASAQAADDDKDFKPLFNGKDMSGFKFVPAQGTTWTVQDGTIICTGKPNGYFHTDKSYKNYHLRFEVKFARPQGLEDETKFGGNSGYLIHIQGEHKVWPKCVEVQGMNRDMGNIFSIGGAPRGTFMKDAAAQKATIKPVGQWNVMEIICQDGKITCMINGKKVSEGTSELTEGPIGWQSEGAEIHFKEIKIKEAK
jgi:hypothetical protein